MAHSNEQVDLSHIFGEVMSIKDDFYERTKVLEEEIDKLHKRIEVFEMQPTDGTAQETVAGDVVDIIKDAEHPTSVYDLIQNVVLGTIFLVFVVRTVAMSRYGKRDSEMQNEQLRIEKENNKILRALIKQK